MRSAFAERVHLQKAQYLHERLREGPPGCGRADARAYINRYSCVERELNVYGIDIALR